MKIDRNRSLKNNVFLTKLKRVIDDDQNCVLIEKKLEDDFGPVEIQIGGLIEIVVAQDGHGTGLKYTPVTSENPKRESTDIISFQLPSERKAITMDSELCFKCDASQETDRVFFEKTATALRIAEEKCKAYEAVILDRLKLAVNAWKAKKTTFEEEPLESVHFDLSK